MKKLIFLFSVLFLFSCNSDSSDSGIFEKDSAKTIEISIIEEPEGYQNGNSEDNFEFLSVLRPDESDISLGNQYIDVLTFIDHNADSYFAYSRFVTETGDTVVLLHNDPIDNSNNGKLMKVLWEIDGFSEPGDGAEMFYKESLVSYELVEKGTLN